MNLISAVATTRLDPIRAEIGARIVRLEQQHARLSIREIARRTDALRELGRRHGLVALCQIATSLNDALARDGRAAILPAYLQTMLDAVYCDSQGADSVDLFLASVSVRLAS